MTFVVFAGLCVANGLFGCGASHPAAAPPTRATTDHARWMENCIDALGNQPLNKLVLPASHDSAMYLSGFPQSLARTQNLTVYGQLLAGIRYFDLRPECREHTLFIHHGMVKGPPLADVISDVRRFLKEGHHELIILKFSHYDGFSPEAYAMMLRQIDENVKPWLYKSLPPGKRLADITLGEYLLNSGTVLVVCDGDYPLQKPAPGIWVYRDWDSADPDHGDLRVYDQYSNTTSYPSMKSDQLRKFHQYDGMCKNRPDVSCDLFLLSWTLTPLTDVPAFAMEPNRKLAQMMEQLNIPNGRGRIVNLLYADCVDADLTETAIHQNLRFANFSKSRGAPAKLPLPSP